MNTHDKALFVQLIQENKGIIFKICNSYCADKNDREDLAQEIIYNLWKSFFTYDNAFKFSTWMYRVALNVAISFYRKENKFKLRASFSENLLLFEETKDDEDDTRLGLLLKFINDLKEIDKSVMLLYLDNKGYKEIAAITGITESNVATKINRTRQKLIQKFNHSK